MLVISCANAFVRRGSATPSHASAIETDKQRFAKLLVTEIKLNNEREIEMWRRNKDLQVVLFQVPPMGSVCAMIIHVQVDRILPS